MDSNRTCYQVVDRLAVEVHKSRLAMGTAAARSVAAYLKGVIAERGYAKVVFACAPSQDEFYTALCSPEQTGVVIDWSRIVAFHMDDYFGLTAKDPQSFRYYLQKHLLDRVPVGLFHPLKGEDVNPQRICATYANLLSVAPIDLICMGIGENGHIAFNDPPVADFEDPYLVKLVELDEDCRRQQVNDGCFPEISKVPTHALTLTVPVFRNARRLSIHVPGPRKAPAVKAALEGSISTACPASILRTHPAATLYLDTESAAAL